MDERIRASLNLSLPCDSQAPAAVRDAVSWLGSIGPSVEDAMLVASELVTDVVRHSGAKRGSLAVVVRGFEQHLLISVRGPRLPERGSPAPALAACAAEGLGRRIIEGLSSRSGSERQDAYTLWAELPLTVYANAG